MPRDLWMEEAAALGWLKANNVTATPAMVRDLAELLHAHWDRGHRLGLLLREEAK